MFWWNISNSILNPTSLWLSQWDTNICRNKLNGTLDSFISSSLRSALCTPMLHQFEPKAPPRSHAATFTQQSEMNCDFTLKNTRPELFLLHFRSRAQPFIPNLPYWLNGAIITAMESSPQRGLRGHSAQLRLIYWPLTGVWSKQYQSTSMNHVCWKPPLLTMPCNFRVIYSRWLFGAGAMPPNASRGAWWEMAAF